MPFAVRHLSVLSYAQGFTAWHYKGRDVSLAEATEPAFFSPVADMMEAGDMISISARDGGATVFVHSTNKTSAVLTAVMASTAPNNFRAAA